MFNCGYGEHEKSADDPDDQFWQGQHAAPCAVLQKFGRCARAYGKVGGGTASEVPDGTGCIQ